MLVRIQYLGEESERSDRAAAGLPPRSAQPNSCGRLQLLQEEMYNREIMEGIQTFLYCEPGLFYIFMFLESEHSNEVLCRFPLRLWFYFCVTATNQVEINHLSVFFKHCSVVLVSFRGLGEGGHTEAAAHLQYKQRGQSYTF